MPCAVQYGSCCLLRSFPFSPGIKKAILVWFRFFDHFECFPFTKKVVPNHYHYSMHSFGCAQIINKPPATQVGGLLLI